MRGCIGLTLLNTLICMQHVMYRFLRVSGTRLAGMSFTIMSDLQFLKQEKFFVHSGFDEVKVDLKMKTIAVDGGCSIIMPSAGTQHLVEVVKHVCAKSSWIFMICLK